GAPFYGGTYFPPADRGGTPSFGRVLTSLAGAWRERSQEVGASAADLTAHLKGLERTFGAGAQPQLDVSSLMAETIAALEASEDEAGGFGGAPKFPPHAALALLLASRTPTAMALAERTLDAMAAGGVHDHLGGGFFRYSVDRHWRLPHFEKMLSDNAQLLGAYTHAAKLSPGPGEHRVVASRIIDWLERELALTTTTLGTPVWQPAKDEIAFFTATDADSEGEEGRFYAWTETEFRAVITAAEEERTRGVAPDDAAALAARHFGVTVSGTYEGGNVLYLAKTADELAHEQGLSVDVIRAALSRAAEALFGHRSTRVRPATDDKVVTSTNALALAALADAGRLLGDERALSLARRLSSFLHRHLWRGGRLFHVWREGEARVEGLLEDYAYTGLGLLALYRATFEPWLLAWAFELADQCESRFADVEGGGYFTTASDAEPLLIRPKGQTDGSTPSESVAASELVWLAARYRSDVATADRAVDWLRGVEQGVRVAPQAFASCLRLLAKVARPAREVVLVGVAGSAELADLVTVFRAHDDGTDVVLVVTGTGHPLAGLPLLEGRVGPTNEGARAYVCHDGVCDLPVGDAPGLSALLRQE
ncbi:MAG TPA: DUF255 domain-containing protein, partial [Trueperaceae bacterium]|nr:DUF255 domain-containing protein [Trueperaceae bacterium]